MNTFFKRSLQSQKLSTTTKHIDWSPPFTEDHILSGLELLTDEINCVIQTPKGSIFGARDLGTTLHKYLFAPLDVLTETTLKEELSQDLSNQITTHQITLSLSEVSIQEKSIALTFTIRTPNKTYTFTTGVSQR